MLHSIGFWNFKVFCLASQNVLTCWWFSNHILIFRVIAFLIKECDIVMHNWSIWRVVWKFMVEAVLFHCRKAAWHFLMTMIRPGPLKRISHWLASLHLNIHYNLWNYRWLQVKRHEEDYAIYSLYLCLFISQMQAKRYEEFYTVYYNFRTTKYLLRVLHLHIICFFWWGGLRGGCLFVWGFSSHYGWKASNLTFTRHLWPLSSVGSFNVVRLHRHEASVWMVFNGGSKSGHRMKLLLSVNWNIYECPLNAHGMFTEIWISGTVQWPFTGHSVQLNAAEWQAHFSDHLVIFFNFQGKKFKKKISSDKGFINSYYLGLQRIKQLRNFF